MYQLSEQTINELNAIGLTLTPEDQLTFMPADLFREVQTNEAWKDFIYNRLGGDTFKLTPKTLKRDNIFIQLPNNDIVILSLFDMDKYSAVHSTAKHNPDFSTADHYLTYEQCLVLNLKD